MQSTDLIELFINPIHRNDIPYMVTGSVAGMIYGEPRLTNDVDVVVMLNSEQISRLHAIFPSPCYYCPPDDVIFVENARSSRGHFNVIHMDSGNKADFYIASTSLHLWGMAAKRLVDIDHSPIWIAPPEYVILRKLEFYREGGSQKHILDIRSMLLTSGELIDRDTIRSWCVRLGVEAQWSLATHPE